MKLFYSFLFSGKYKKLFGKYKLFFQTLFTKRAKIGVLREYQKIL